MIALTLPIAALEFLSWSMLGWLAVGLLPWLIHRLHRRHHLTTNWAAIELLLAALEQRARRIRFQQWLLLALRTAILLLVAFSAAEPVWRQWALGAAGGTRVHRILVLDRSYSMHCQQEDADRYAVAQSHVRRLIEAADAVSLIAWGEEVEDVVGRPTADTSLALSALERIEAGYARADLQAALQAVTSTLDRAEQESPQLSQHQVFFLTDMARNTWSADETVQAQIDQLAARASLTVINVGGDGRENVAVTKLSVQPATVLRGREVTVTASLRNFGQQESTDLPVQFIVDGRPLNSRTVDLPAGGVQVVNFTHQFIDEGQYTLEVALGEETDCLAVDNRRWLVLDVRPQLRVACLEGRPGAARDVARALSFAQGAIAPEILSANRLSTLELAAYDAILLAEMVQPSPRELAQLTQYVQAGGALVVLLGRQSVAWDGLPVEITGAAEAGTYRFDPLEYRHPIVQPFRGREQAGLLSVMVSRYVRMQARERAATVLAFDTGDPALVVAKQGLGSVAVLALPASLATEGRKPWSSFAISPSFLPVMRELLTHLIGDRWLEQRNLLPNQVAMTAWQPTARGQELAVRLPTGRTEKLPLPGAEDQHQLAFAGTDEIGVYSLVAEDEEFARFAVNLDAESARTDSELATLAPGELPAGINAAAPAAEAQFAAADYSLVRTLLLAALMLLFVEQAMAWLIGRRWA